MPSKKSIEKRKIILEITPQTWVRVTQKDKIFFRIPRDKLRPAGLKRRMRIERYNDYKLNVSAEAKRLHFNLPDVGAGILFYVPVPKSWSKKKKRLHHGQFHHSRPDLKNLLQAFEDSLMSEDMTISYYTHLGKIWVNEEAGWIEITITDPSNIFISPPTEGKNRLL
jgi:Holliday junction resolvase RusA-like endonuclease